jgi:MFS family permease
MKVSGLTPRDEDSPPLVSPFWAWTGLGILLVLSFVATLDRQIVSLMVGLIKDDLNITDSHIAILQGAAFGLAYTIFTIPFGILADRYSRRLVIFFGVLFWSAAAVASGLAGSFSTLLAARIGVGIGEAALVPAATSLLASMFPRRRLSFVLSIFTTGQLMGVAGALAIGGWVISWAEGGASVPFLGHLAAWQIAFIVTGAPAAVMAFLIFLVPEPKRTPKADADATAKEKSQGDKAELLAFLRRERAFIIPYLGADACLKIIGYANVFWVPVVLQRVYDWSVVQVGATLGLYTLAVGLSGGLIHGLAVDALYGRGFRDAQMRYFAFTGFIVCAAALVAPSMATGFLYLAVWFVGKFCVNYGGPIAAALVLATPAHLRARMTAISNAVCVTIGIVAGPSCVASLTDFVFRDDNMVAWSLAITLAVFSALGAIMCYFAMKPMREAVARQELDDPESVDPREAAASA